MRTVMRRPDFRRLFAGLVVSMTAESMLILVLAIWVKGLTGSDGLAAATIFAIVAPMSLAPLVGWFTDRFRRRPFLVAANLTVAVLLTPLLLVTDASDVWIIFTVAAVYGLSYIAIAAAIQGLIKEVVPHDLLAEANGALQTVKQGLRLVGPLGGAGLYTLFHASVVAMIASAAFVLAAAVIATIGVREQRPVAGELHWLAEATAGARHLFGEPALRRLVLGVALTVLAFGMAEALFFAYIDQGLNRPEAFLGVLSAALGVGGIAGGLSASAVIRRLGEVGTAGAGITIVAAGGFLFTYPHLVLGLTAAPVVGFGIPLVVVSLHTLLQRRTPQRLMGRTVAAVEMVIVGPQTLAIGAGAVLVGVVDYRLLFAAVGTVVAAAALYVWRGRRLSKPATLTAPEPATEPAIGHATRPAAGPATADIVDTGRSHAA
jgi:predicted MFS family arabinose efflux permease